MYAIINTETNRILSFTDKDEETKDGCVCVSLPKDTEAAPTETLLAEAIQFLKVSKKDGKYKISKDSSAEKDAALDSIRKKRDALLSACDWTILPDCPLDNKTQNKWEEYRQTLRDLPKKLKDPRKEVKWPKKPGDK